MSVFLLFSFYLSCLIVSLDPYFFPLDLLFDWALSVVYFGSNVGRGAWFGGSKFNYVRLGCCGRQLFSSRLKYSRGESDSDSTLVPSWFVGPLTALLSLILDLHLLFGVVCLNTFLDPADVEALLCVRLAN